MRSISQSSLLALAALVCAAAVSAQERRPAPMESTQAFMAGEPAMAATVRGAPYSGEGRTTVTQTLGDGTRIERSWTTRVYRDSEGRVRREQPVVGLGPLSPSGDEPRVVTIADPVAHVTYVLDPRTREAHRARGGLRQAFDVLPPPPPPPPPPPGPPDGPRARGSFGQMGRGREGPGGRGMKMAPPPGEPLGSRRIDGLEVVGTRYTTTIEVGRIGNDRPIDVVDERWESPALKVIVESRHSDPRTGVVEYRLANISRAEQPRELFTVPADYTIVDAPPPPPPPPGPKR